MIDGLIPRCDICLNELAERDHLAIVSSYLQLLQYITTGSLTTLQANNGADILPGLIFMK